MFIFICFALLLLYPTKHFFAKDRINDYPLLQRLDYYLFTVLAGVNRHRCVHSRKVGYIYLLFIFWGIAALKKKTHWCFYYYIYIHLERPRTFNSPIRKARAHLHAFLPQVRLSPQKTPFHVHRNEFFPEGSDLFPPSLWVSWYRKHSNLSKEPYFFMTAVRIIPPPAPIT